MSSNRQIELALKKQRLQYRCAEQRREIARHLRPMIPYFAIAERVRGGSRWVREHPAISIGVLLAFCAAKPRLAVRWARRVWVAWRGWRKLKSMAVSVKSVQAA